MGRKKGQIEFVAIAAFVVLILVAVFFILQPPQSQGDPWSNLLSDEQRIIRDSLKNFLKLATEEELTRLYEQGGFIDITGTVNIKFSGLEIPLWSSCGTINIPDIEKELARGINEYIVRNLERDTEFYGKETIIDVSKLKTQVILQNKKITVRFSLPATVRGFEMPDAYEVETGSNLKEILEFSKGLTYELNETRFLEMITIINMLHSNKTGSAWTPVKGTLTRCGERIVVRREQFLEGVKQMLRYTASHLVWDRNPPRIADNPFFVLNSIESKRYDLDVSFFYPEEWDDELSEKFITFPETLRKTAKPILRLVPVCIEQYAVSYSFQYPMIIAVNDDIMNQHFRFAVYASIKDNQPDTECKATLFDGKTDYEEKCIENANCEFNIRVTDSAGSPIKGVDVTFYGCDLGVTNEAGMLVSDTVKAPCMMSELVVRKEGFMSEGHFLSPDDFKILHEVGMKRITPIKIKYYGIPMAGIKRNSEGIFENFVIIDQIQHMDRILEYFSIPPKPLRLEASLVMRPINPNPFTEEDADFLVTNTDDEGTPLHEKEETIIHPLKYEISGLVTDISRDAAIGYIEQEFDVREGVNELCVYFPVVVGELNPPYAGIKTLKKSVRNDQSGSLKNRLLQAGLHYLIGECGSPTLTACGDGICQSGETCETDGNVKCPEKEALPSGTCRITCNYCGDGILDSGWEECDFMDNSPYKNWGLGTGEDDQYVCNSTCEQDGGWCGDGIVQDGSQYEGAEDFGEECDFGTDNNCCEDCKWTCDEIIYESTSLKFDNTDTSRNFESGDIALIKLPACRIVYGGYIDINAEELSSVPGEIKITIGGIEHIFEAGGEEENYQKKIEIDLSSLSGSCSENPQIIQFTTSFEGGGEIECSNFMIRYCEACNPDS